MFNKNRGIFNAILLYIVNSRFHEAIGNVLIKKCIQIPFNLEEYEKVENCLLIFGEKVKIVDFSFVDSATLTEYLGGGNGKNV